jgi:hypothetical protein
MKKPFWGILRLAIVLVLIAVFGMLVMLLWNWLLPVIAGLPAITFLQAVGLLALSRILFGGLGGIGRGFVGGTMGDHINPFREKWGKMSDEERQEFIRKHRLFHHEDSPPIPGNGKE